MGRGEFEPSSKNLLKQNFYHRRTRAHGGRTSYETTRRLTTGPSSEVRVGEARSEESSSHQDRSFANDARDDSH